jgi:hypothetical protein
MSAVVHRVTAHNDATASENRIHDDEVARQYGFAGGLVPGVTVYAYLTHPAAARWGPAWVSRGTMSARFAKPVYDGEPIEVRAGEGDDGALDLTLVGADGGVRASGRATLPDVPGAAPDPAAFPQAPLPASGNRRPASFAELAPGRRLGSVERTWTAVEAESFLDAIGEDLDWYRSPPIAHPGWLVRGANSVLSRTVRLGPWIHVGSDGVHHGHVADGARVSTRGCVADAYERKGHKFVELDVLVLADEQPVMSIRHVAIFEPRRITR